MTSRALPWLLALAGAALVLVLGAPTEDIYWSDHNVEAWPAFAALVEGDVRGFIDLTPLGYAGSVLLRAPVAALAGALGYGEVGVFRAGAVLCVLPLAALAAHLAIRARAAHPGERWWLLVLALGAASPIAWKAVWFGHPEEALTTALAVAAVLVALARRPVLAGALLGAAVACKPWAVIAGLPVLLAAPGGHVRLLAAAGVSAGGLLAPVWLADPQGFASAGPNLATSVQWFRPRQLWWPFGAPGTPDMPPGFATTPGWLAELAKPLIVALTVPLSLAWARRRDRRTDVLGLLALLMLLRCLLDPWNVVYYHLPLVIALLAWEVLDGRRIPLVTLITTTAIWLSFQSYDAATGLLPWLAYLAWTLPLGAYLAWRVYRLPVPAPRVPGLATT